MATRATYSFEDKCYDRLSTVYIHYDGYPDGAARYFLNMHLSAYSDLDDYAPNKGCEFFIVGNIRYAEITKCHEYHSDTEYRYYLDSNCNLTAYERNWETDKFIEFFHGHYCMFINEYLGVEHFHALSQDMVKDRFYNHGYLSHLDIKAVGIYYLKQINKGNHYCAQIRKHWAMEDLRIADVEYQE